MGGNAVKYAFDLTFISEMIALKNAMNQVQLFLNQNCTCLPSSDLLDLRLIFNELLCNAVLHGNKLDKNKIVTIAIQIDADLVYAKISDEGSGFVCTDDKDFNDSEHGRGIDIVVALTDQVNFLGAGNEVEFYKKVNING